ncbi:anti-sigma factor family protein [Streptomyces beihaiensis]|uniref:Zf-HC2 domain-containing protein n=1 Tax=Streptomyces beihaiensis TaxID=2984495 RepID=A0ABT3TXF6_9ACTN|nr:zf-HC2 domain-containing protein [Streptomyces beihaiensis]MCX3061732.1 zf-HC2 domain-containing protein [Streptomyces beihaiensis]
MDMRPKRRRRGERGLNCLRVARVLRAYLDGETDDATARRVAAHLEDCRRRGLEARTYREIKNALARCTEPEPATIDRLRGFTENLLKDGHDGTWPPAR